MEISAGSFKVFAHLFLAGVTAAIVWSALQTLVLSPAENAIGV